MVRKALNRAGRIAALWRVVRRITKDERTPFVSKALLWTALIYLVVPFDISTDFIPLLGQLDDVVVAAVLSAVALALLPKGVLKDSLKK